MSTDFFAQLLGPELDELGHEIVHTAFANWPKEVKKEALDGLSSSSVYLTTEQARAYLLGYEAGYRARHEKA